MVKVLIAVDASDNAEKAFDWYVKNFHKPDDTIVILHVSDPPKLPTLSFTEPGSFPADGIAKLMVESNKKVAALENNYSTKCGQQKIKNKIAVRVGEGGSPGAVVLEAAKQEEVSAIVMGTRGLGTVRRTFLGSVSDYVIHHSKIPVLVVPKQ